MSGAVGFLLALALVATLGGLAIALGLIGPGPGGTAVATTPPATGAQVTPAPSPTAEPATPSAPPTVAPSPTSAIATAPPSPGGIHIVQPGESLFQIGVIYGVPWELIAEANQIAGPGYIIKIGDELIIPLPTAASPGGDTIHVVQSGETIVGIAEMYGVTPTELADANEIEDWNLIFVGQRLVIPTVGASPSP